MSAIRWSWTLNNPTEAEINYIEECSRTEEPIQYLIYGKEIGDEGTPHLQGYLEMKSRTRMGGVKRWIGDRVHLEIARGTAVQNIEYCSKDGDTWTFGEPRVQGRRTDLDASRALAEEEGMRSVSSTCSVMQIRVAEKYLEYNETARDWLPTVRWFWGPTGTGKSRTARELCSDDTYIKNNDSKWWTGYDRHECVIIDDFRPSWWHITEMLRLLDRYECLLEVKGGHRQLVAKTIIVTSSLRPNDCYIHTGEAITQLMRRITEVRHFP